MGARIFAIVDAYDAMRSQRVYRDTIAMPEVVEEIKSGSGTQFDPRMVEIMLKCIDDFELTGQWP